MKKLISILLMLMVVLGSMCIASAEVIMLPDYEITKEGEITAYHGAQWVVVPGVFYNENSQSFRKFADWYGIKRSINIKI